MLKNWIILRNFELLFRGPTLGPTYSWKSLIQCSHPHIKGCPLRLTSCPQGNLLVLLIIIVAGFVVSMLCAYPWKPTEAYRQHEVDCASWTLVTMFLIRTWYLSFGGWWESVAPLTMPHFIGVTCWVGRFCLLWHRWFLVRNSSLFVAYETHSYPDFF